MTAFADTLARVRAETGDTPLERVPTPTTREIGVGWSVWERSPDGTDYDPRGGTVLHVIPNGVHDEDTGEAYDRYVVVRVGRFGLHWTSLRADQLGPIDDGSRPNAHSIAGVCHAAARELVELLRPKARGEAPDMDKALDLFSLGARLTAAVARPAAVAP